MNGYSAQGTDRKAITLFFENGVKRNTAERQWQSRQMFEGKNTLFTPLRKDEHLVREGTPYSCKTAKRIGRSRDGQSQVVGVEIVCELPLIGMETEATFSWSPTSGKCGKWEHTIRTANATIVFRPNDKGARTIERFDGQKCPNQNWVVIPEEHAWSCASGKIHIYICKLVRIANLDQILKMVKTKRPDTKPVARPQKLSPRALRRKMARQNGATTYAHLKNAQAPKHKKKEKQQKASRKEG